MQGCHIIFSLKVKERRYMMTGAAMNICQLERKTLGLQLSSTGNGYKEKSERI